MGVLRARAGDPTGAVELLGLASTAPKNLMGWLERWPLMLQLRSDLMAEIGEQSYHTAWEHGKSLALDAVIAERLGTSPLSKSESLQKMGQPLVEPLSERELQVLRLMADGLSNAEIGQKLFLSVETVKVHARNIYGKLGVGSRTQAIAQGRKLSLL